MSATITEVLMAQGAVSIEFEPDPDLYAELVKGPNGEERDGRGLVIYWGEFPEPFGCIKVGDVPSRDVIAVNAVGLEWLLGNANGDIGPTDVETVYVAGNNKLANPLFLYTFTEASVDDLGNPTTRVTADAWKLADKTDWVIAVGSATVTDALRAGLADVDPDLSLPSDILISDESFEVAAGDQHRLAVTASRPTGTIGRLRPRLVYDGHFRHPNVLPVAISAWTVDPDNLAPGDAKIVTTGTKHFELGPVTRQIRLLDSGWTDTSEFSGDTVDTGSWLTIGPCTQPQYIANNSFETGDLTDWAGSTGTDGGGHDLWDVVTGPIGVVSPRSGSYMLETLGVTDTPERWLGPSTGPAVLPGERYRLQGFVTEGLTTTGEAVLLLQPIRLSGASNYLPSASTRGSDYTSGSPFQSQWKQLAVEYTVETDVTALQPWLHVILDTVSGSRFIFDDITLTRIKGNLCQSAGTSFPVVAGDTYEVVSQAFANTNMTDGQVVMAVTMTGSGKPDITVKSNPVLPDNKALIRMTATITPDDGYTDAYVTFNGIDVAGDSVVCNYPVVTRTVGNTAKIDAPAVSVVPEESYTFQALVTADAAVTQGTVGVSFLCRGAGRPDQVIDALDIDSSSITPRGLFIPFATPSGYDTVTPILVGTDILGGKFTVGVPTFTLTDPKRLARDAVMGPSLAGTQTGVLTSTAPIGAEHVHAEVVAEDKADGYAVTQVSLARAETPSTSGDVARSLLKDPKTGLQLVQEGSIVGTEAIAFDWHVRRLTQRTKLQHLSRAGLAVPVREWRFYLDAVTGKPTMDWGTPEAIFADRTDLIFVDDDLKLMAPPSLEHSAESRVTDVTVVGADRERPDNTPLQITGEATNPNDDFLDWDGNPLNRTQTAPDSSANHTDYAAALARYKADLVATPPENVRMQVSDLRAWLEKGPAHVGDWVYVYKPDARIEDTSNPMEVDGRTVFPKKLRIISRIRKLGSGDFRIEIHRPGLDPYEVNDSLVRWESETSEELELGDPLPEFSPDEQGGPALDQLRRLRASMPKR